MTAQLLNPILEVERIEQDYFRGIATPGGQGRSFGGQVIAQALASATHTVEPDRACHSLHAYFMRPGDATKPVLFQVNRDMEGRNFSMRRVTAVQSGRPILALACSFQTETEGFTHAAEMPAGMPDPESLVDDRTLGRQHADRLSEKALAYLERNRAIETRLVTMVPPFVDTAVEGRINRWIRAKDLVSDDPAVHRAALAYASDMGLLLSGLWRHGLDLFDERMRCASLDHAVWFHGPFRADEWLLYSLHSSWAGNARGLCDGQVFTRDGRHVASTRQEGLMRMRMG